MSAFINQFSPPWKDAFNTVTTVLTAVVPNAGTFTINYPAGTTQETFIDGLANTGHYAMVGNNDKYPVGTPGFSYSFGASNITVTNNANALPAGTSIVFYLQRKNPDDVVVLSFPFNLVNIAANGDILTNIKLGISGVIESVWFAVTVPVTTASRAATLNLEIGTTDVTGGTVALTSALATPIGKVIKNTADPSANNVLTEDSVFSIEASGVTAFAEGAGVLYVRIRKSTQSF